MTCSAELVFKLTKDDANHTLLTLSPLLVVRMTYY